MVALSSQKNLEMLYILSQDYKCHQNLQTSSVFHHQIIKHNLESIWVICLFGGRLVNVHERFLKFIIIDVVSINYVISMTDVTVIVDRRLDFFIVIITILIIVEIAIIVNVRWLCVGGEKKQWILQSDVIMIKYTWPSWFGSTMSNVLHVCTIAFGNPLMAIATLSCVFWQYFWGDVLKKTVLWIQ